MIFPAKNFKRSEFACHCGCGFNTVDAELLAVLDMLRDDIDLPIHITSGCRCNQHNTFVDGAKNSQHMTGKAADIKIIGMKPTDVYNLLNDRYPHTYGIGLYKSWVHIDIRCDKARW